jgi:5-methylcytosine-specific restriction endonuclease McrA
MKALKLDSSFRPIEVIDAIEALVLCIIGKAKAVETYGQKIRSATRSFDLPAVIVLNRYVKFRFSITRVNRKNVLWRDENRCQYCAKTFLESELTLDHIIPKSRGGNNSWKNLVAACKRCNQKKGAKTPQEANMYPLKEPRPPKLSLLKNLNDSQVSELWREYLWELSST